MASLRPLNLGELLDQAVVAWRSQWKPLLLLNLGFQLVQYVLVKLWQLGVQTWAPAALSAPRLKAALELDPLATLGQLGFSGLAGGVLALLSLCCGELASVALTAFMYPRVTAQGEPPWGDALRVCVRRAGALTGALSLGLGWTMTVALTLELPALLLGAAAFFAGSRGATLPAAGLGVAALGLGLLAAIVVLLWFITRFFCLPQIAAVEPGGAWHVFRRSAALTSGRVQNGFLGVVKVRLAILITVIALIVGTLSFVSSIPALVLQVVYGNLLDPQHADQAAIPASLLVPAELLQVAISSLFAPVYTVFQVLFYVDMQVRREGLDLELELAAKPAS